MCVVHIVDTHSNAGFVGVVFRLCFKVLVDCSAQITVAEETFQQFFAIHPAVVPQCMFGLVGACNPYQQLFQSRQSRRARQSSAASSSSSFATSSRPVKRPRYRVDTDSLFRQLQQRGLLLHCTACDKQVLVEHNAPLKCPTCNESHLDVMPTPTRKVISAR